MCSSDGRQTWYTRVTCPLPAQWWQAKLIHTCHMPTASTVTYTTSLSNCTQRLTKLSHYSSSGSSTEKLDYCWQKWVLKTVHPALDQLMEMNCFVEVYLEAQCCIEKMSTVPSLRTVINPQMSVGDWISCLVIFQSAVVLWSSVFESAVLVLL